MNRHNRIYTILLIVLAFFTVISVISMASMTQAPSVKPESRWFFVMLAWYYAAYVAAIIVTLVLRGASHVAGRMATTALNIILLIMFPVGTAIGIYGLIKVDKQGEPACA